MNPIHLIVLGTALIASSSGLAQPTAADHPMHGPSTWVGQMSQDTVEQLLRQHGFSDVQQLRLESGIWRGEGTRDGTRSSFEVDAISGRLLKP